MNNPIAICNKDEIISGTGVCALIDGFQVAIFRLNDDEFYAVDNFDPIGNAYVLSRGLTGSIGDKKVVASPLYKQHYDLETGACLEDDSVQLKTFNVYVENNIVMISHDNNSALINNSKHQLGSNNASV